MERIYLAPGLTVILTLIEYGAPAVDETTRTYFVVNMIKLVTDSI